MKTKKRLFICVFAHLVVGCTCLYFSVANASEASPKRFLNPNFDQAPKQVQAARIQSDCFEKTGILALLAYYQY